MKKALFIIAQKDFRDEELFEPLEILKNNSVDCKIASIEKKECIGMLGAKVMPDLEVKEADAEEIDIVIVVGGSGSPGLADHKEVLDLLKEMKAKDKPIAAICLAPMVLAKADVITGKKATVYETEDSLKALNEGGAEFVKQDVVTDDKLVTACGPQAASEFGKAILELL